MRLICITDLHGNRAALEAILDDAGAVDLILVGGDITHFGTPNAVEGLIKLAQGRCQRVLAVAGNCDSAAIDQRLTELEVSLFGRGTMYRQCGFYGVSSMPPWHGTMYELSEEAIAEALIRGRQQLEETHTEIVLSHAPPRDTSLDRTSSGQHVGSTAVRRFIEQYQPQAMFCGHIHEARGVETLGKTLVVNCGPANKGHYAEARIDGGVEVLLKSVAI
jgi:Icc-related predicted phosphoesterase